MIYGYGKLVNKTIELNHPLQIIYGANEAGKSTIIDFIKSILFGFQSKKQAKHGQYVPRNNAPYGGEIFFQEDGINYRLVRTKGRLTPGDIKFYNADTNTQLPNQNYEKLISPIDRETFDEIFYYGDFSDKDIFGLKTDELRARIQQIGVPAAPKWLDIQKNIDKQAADIYKKKGRKPVLNLQLKSLEALRQKVSNAKLNYPQYQKLNQHLIEAKNQLQEEEKTHSLLQAKFQKSQKLELALPKIQKLNKLSKIDNKQVKPGFEQSDWQEFNRLSVKLANFKKQSADLKKRINELSESQNTNDSLNFYQKNKTDILNLTKQLPKMRDVLSSYKFYSNQKTDVQTEINRISNSIPRNNSNQLPTVLTNEMESQITELLQKQKQLQNQISQISKNHDQRSKNSQPTGKDRTPIILISLGVLSFILSFVLKASFGWILIILGIILIALGTFRNIQKPISNSNSQQKNASAKTINLDPTFSLEVVRQKIDAIQKTGKLSGIPPENWLYVQSQLKQLTQKQNDFKNAENQENISKETLDSFIGKWQFSNNYLDFGSDLTYSQMFELISNQVSSWKQAESKSQMDSQNVDEFKKSFEDAKVSELKALAQYQNFLTSRGLTNEQEFNERFNQQAKIKQDVLQAKNLKSELIDQGFKDVANQDLEKIKSEINHDQTLFNDSQNQITELSKRVSTIEVQIDDLVKNGEYSQLKQQLADQESLILSYVQEYAALSLSSQWIDNALNIASKGRLPKILSLANKYFQTLTKSAYKDIEFDERIKVVRSDGESFQINELSKGTLEQLYLSLIFSMTVGFSSEYRLPIIIDDGFVNFDEQRRAAAFELLNKISEKTQVIYFTANLDRKVSEDNLLKL